jgi:hypothetical protein
MRPQKPTSWPCWRFTPPRVSETLEASPLTIASLRSLYQRRPTLYEHQQWARNYLGLRDLDAAAEADLVAMLALHAAEAAHADDLVTSACHWLYDHRILIPGQRRVQDWARDAFATIEANIRSAIASEVTPAALRRCRESAYSQRPDGAFSHLEWIKTPSRRHGPSTLTETLEKISYLKSLRVHEWSLTAVSLPKQHAYAQQVQARRPAKNRELKETRQAIELVCFLRVSLLELTDIAVQQNLRRSQQLFREATQKVKTTRDLSDSVARHQARLARDVLRDAAKPFQARCFEADRLLSNVLDAPPKSFVSEVRKALSTDHQRQGVSGRSAVIGIRWARQGSGLRAAGRVAPAARDEGVRTARRICPARCRRRLARSCARRRSALRPACFRGLHHDVPAQEPEEWPRLDRPFAELPLA